ncbi:hypothetical protein CDN99_23535 [Roseateles aquatilis]|uniref:UDP-N-acetylglucosamine acyltransferase n=1 Tax=Roseateles aquatilis TaxID=431061 RepID=A0A246IWZ1_9BURK|nr:hypothetical protein [Roseateles aquatilis]OWQ84710.1 hypothetical protein CDN99_23535 [Roseateles aquatilis]
MITKNRFASVVALSVAALLVGCAAPARVEQMQVSNSLAVRTAAAQSELKDGIGIKDVTGGKETNPMWVSNVSSADFERALEASLKDAGLLSGNRQGSKYVLVAHLAKLEQPFMGASMTVTATVRYSLIDRATNKTVFERDVATPYTAAFSDAFVGTERLKLANEGAVRTNITQLINDLVALKVSVADVQMAK